MRYKICLFGTLQIEHNLYSRLTITLQLVGVICDVGALVTKGEGRGVGSFVGCDTGGVVGRGVGRYVGKEVGVVVGKGVGVVVGRAEGDFVGRGVGGFVNGDGGFKVGGAVGGDVGVVGMVMV